MIDLESLSVGATITAALAGMITGALWYSPILFGNAWMNALGKTADQLGPIGPAMGGSLIACALSALTIEFVTIACGVSGLSAGLGIGAILGVGLVAMAMLSDSLFCGWGWRLYWIQAGYRVTYLILMGGICGAWPR